MMSKSLITALLLLLPAPVMAVAPPTDTVPPAVVTAKPTPAQQAVLDRIRKLRDGDSRTFGDCSYRWDQWKLIANGVRTTSFSCKNSDIVNQTVGVSCGGLTINFYRPTTPQGQTPETWTWSQWRLPEAGAEEQMVATLCANALPTPAVTTPSKPKPSTPAQQ
jgi:hypothetical protein